MIQAALTTRITYLPLHTASENAEQRWVEFIRWFYDLERWVQAVATEETGLGNSSPITADWLWVHGANTLFENDPMAVRKRLRTMPTFPSEWPSSEIAAPVLSRLAALDAMQALTVEPETRDRFARDLRQQAVRLLQMADEAEDAIEAERAEAAQS